MTWTATGAAATSWNSTTTISAATWGSGQTILSQTYSEATPGVLTLWAHDHAHLYPEYDIGINMMIHATTQYYNSVGNDRPIAVPPGSGYSVP